MDNNPIAFALDFPTLTEATKFVDEHQLHHHLGAVKIGLELFISSGPAAVASFLNFGFSYTKIPVILDLKLHDIPETVARAVKAGGDLGVKFMTLHVQQRAALEKAIKAAEPFGITLLGVTVLTSMTVSDFKDLDLDWDDDMSLRGISDVEYRVRRLARFGAGCGLKGFVCSPQEVKMLRDELPEAFFLVPGVRSAGTEKGDQKRTGTPQQAVQDGASMIVVGRQIRDASNPKEALQAILKEAQSS